jgi:ATP-dependent exoDNAse (exonuclease V) beta subunit
MPAWEIDPAELRKELNAVPGPEMPRILQKFEGGKKLLSVLEKLRAEAREPNIPVSAVLERALRNFSLPRSTMPARALRDFVVNWEQKPLTKSKSLAEFLRYLEFFGQADGTVPLPVESEDAVRLMTAHAAKGLEFRHVFILRAYSQRFPNGYHETLFDFPAELRAPDSAENADAKQLHKEEERRLFYVAMTRARDSLFLYGRLQGQSATPAGYIRDLFNDLPARGSWRLSTVPEPRFNLTAGTEAEVITPLESWLFAPAELKSGDLTLSSSAITEYQQCPLRYKINREWRLPPESSPAMRFGNAMHRALKFFGESSDSDAARLRDQVLAAFRKALADAYIEDPVQRRLYEEQGVRQLTEFVALHSGAARANIIGTEKDFKANIGGVTVRGRVDRLDRLPTGCVAVIDYKTGSPRTQEDADDALQLSLYALGAERVWGVKPERLVFYNLETNSEVATTRSGKQLADAELSVQNVAAGIAAGIFDPRPGRHCARCTYNAICPAQERRLFHIETTAAGAGRVN